ncbi:Branched-chain amino acid transport system / permease component [Anaerobium acetethylicum]|uniref:Branched-chain amino acid transport system / permease component n=1 Tax=Anaerobium acetethylicum TaxID=1619234 RepID=A0A1D3TW44_9FIRM|nr:Branched-chain amino acid transport system / permease component [Anaerobium acetethylicum]
MAIGSNENCVRLSGIRVELYIIAVYVISAVCATLGGIMAASRTDPCLDWKYYELLVSSIISAGCHKKIHRYYFNFYSDFYFR